MDASFLRRSSFQISKGFQSLPHLGGDIPEAGRIPVAFTETEHGTQTLKEWPGERVAGHLDLPEPSFLQNSFLRRKSSACGCGFFDEQGVCSVPHAPPTFR